MRAITALTLFNIGVLTYQFGPYVLPISLGCYVLYQGYEWFKYMTNDVDYCVGVIPLRESDIVSPRICNRQYDSHRSQCACYKKDPYDRAEIERKYKCM